MTIRKKQHATRNMQHAGNDIGFQAFSVMQTPMPSKRNVSLLSNSVENTHTENFFCVWRKACCLLRVACCALKAERF